MSNTASNVLLFKEKEVELAIDLSVIGNYELVSNPHFEVNNFIQGFGLYTKHVDPDMIFDSSEMGFMMEGILCTLKTGNLFIDREDREIPVIFTELNFLGTKCTVISEKIEDKTCMYMTPKDYEWFMDKFREYCHSRGIDTTVIEE